MKAFDGSRITATSLVAFVVWKLCQAMGHGVSAPVFFLLKLPRAALSVF